MGGQWGKPLGVPLGRPLGVLGGVHLPSNLYNKHQASDLPNGGQWSEPWDHQAPLVAAWRRLRHQLDVLPLCPNHFFGGHGHPLPPGVGTCPHHPRYPGDNRSLASPLVMGIPGGGVQTGGGIYGIMYPYWWGGYPGI